jgi:predicted metalloprotease with PDZ domain
MKRISLLILLLFFMFLLTSPQAQTGKSSWNFPAWHAGLSPRDTIIEINGKHASSSVLNEIIGSGQPGNEVLVMIGRRTWRCSFEVLSEPAVKRTFAIIPLSQPDPLQKKILTDWLLN